MFNGCGYRTVILEKGRELQEEAEWMRYWRADAKGGSTS